MRIMQIVDLHDSRVAMRSSIDQTYHLLTVSTGSWLYGRDRMRFAQETDDCKDRPH
jgi:hypothetical protein